jgi:hypothetical protein
MSSQDQNPDTECQTWGSNPAKKKHWETALEQTRPIMERGIALIQINQTQPAL